MHDTAEFFAHMLTALQAQFGHAAKAVWVYESDICPCCNEPIDEVIVDGRRQFSINAYMYREKGALIGYLLCSKCAKNAMGQKDDSSEYHASIEKNLKAAYLKHMYSMDA